MQGGVGGAEASSGLVGEAGLQATPDRALAGGLPTDHGGVVRELADHSQLRGEPMGHAVIHQAAVNAVGGAGGAAGDVGGVDVDDVQRLGLRVRSSLRG